MLSVVIVTKDRSEELHGISLPSLAQQDTRDFEVIVWDASRDNASQRIVEAFVATHPDLTVRYFKAPRAGTCSQRNDAVKEARGEIVFFIDDDSEVSPDGVAVMRELFARPELAGGCLPLDYRWPVNKGQSTGGRFTSLLLDVYCRVFYTSPRLSGIYYPPIPPSVPGRIDRLWGCDMAFRKEVFRDHRFDERFQRCGGYSPWEDQMFSHVLDREGLILSVAERGLVIHRAGSGDRGGSPFNKGRMAGYSMGIVWKTSIFPFVRWSVIPFIWSQIGFIGVVLLPCLLQPWRKMRWKKLAGYLAGLWMFMLEEVEGGYARLVR